MRRGAREGERMNRRLFNVLAVLSLVIGIAYAGIFVWAMCSFYNSTYYRNVGDIARMAHRTYHYPIRPWVQLAVVEALLAVLPIMWLT